MNDLQTASDLRGAAKWLRTRGWTQNDYGLTGPSCLIGAIVASQGHRSLEAAELMAGDIGEWSAVVALVPGETYRESEILRWNDQPGRTADEVLDRLESTALALEVRALAAAQGVSGAEEQMLMVAAPAPLLVGV